MRPSGPQASSASRNKKLAGEREKLRPKKKANTQTTKLKKELGNGSTKTKQVKKKQIKTKQIKTKQIKTKQIKTKKAATKKRRKMDPSLAIAYTYFVIKLQPPIRGWLCRAALSKKRRAVLCITCWYIRERARKIAATVARREQWFGMVVAVQWAKQLRIKLILCLMQKMQGAIEIQRVCRGWLLRFRRKKAAFVLQRRHKAALKICRWILSHRRVLHARRTMAQLRKIFRRRRDRIKGVTESFRGEGPKGRRCNSNGHSGTFRNFGKWGVQWGWSCCYLPNQNASCPNSPKRKSVWADAQNVLGDKSNGNIPVQCTIPGRWAIPYAVGIQDVASRPRGGITGRSRDLW
jgi:hypothetical protein